jgi:hypothetical protein
VSRLGRLQSFGPLLYLRSRRSGLIFGICLVIIAVQLMARVSLADTSAIGPRRLVALSPTVCVVLVGATALPALSEWEDMQGDLMLRLRSLQVLAMTVMCTLGAVPGPMFLHDTGWMVRNAGFALGVMLICTVVFEPELNWIVPVSCAAVCYFFGQGDAATSEPRSWALLLAPNDARMLIVAVVTGGSGIFAYVLLGPRRSHAPDAV